MLVELAVTGLGVIDAAELELDRGCSVLTGETGAGKTLLVAGLDLLCGGKADRSLVRAGAPEARVEGRFSLSPGHPARGPLAEHELFDAPPAPGSDAEVVVTRAVPRDGRSKARVNGRIVSLATLSAIGGRLVEIAGQRAHGGVASTTVQRALLDAYAGPYCVRLAADVAAAVAAASRAARDSQRLAAEGRTELELDALAREIAALEARRSEALQRARELAAQLTEVRAERAPGLATELEHLLDGLALPEARVEVRLEPRGLYEGGNESVSFLVATDPGEPTKPLAKVASGGELSRMALALHLLTARGRGRTPGHALVFDEVDAGVGGEAARAVGHYLG